MFFFISVLTFFVSVYFTQYITKQVAFYWRKREDIVQIKLEQVKDKIRSIEDIRNRMVTLSSERQNRALALIECIQEGSSHQDLNELRKLYRQSVYNWNIGLGKINIDMCHLGLQFEAIKMENELHGTFFYSHQYLKKYFQSVNNDHELLEEAKCKLHECYIQTMNHSRVLYEKETNLLSKTDDIYKDDIVSDEKLCQESVLKLIELIFYRRKNCFRINRTS